MGRKLFLGLLVVTGVTAAVICYCRVVPPIRLRGWEGDAECPLFIG